MRVVVGSVVKGFKLKTAIKKWLIEHGYQVVDVGCHDMAVFVKFPSIAERAARVLQQGEADFGVLCCGSGTGMALAVGKFRGICAVSAESVLAAEFARTINDANVLCMGESLVAQDAACRMVEVFLTTDFQAVEGIPQKVLDFWAEARDEIAARGPEACDREMETLD